MIPSVINIGPIPIHLYALAIMTGVVLAAFLAQGEAKRRGQDGALVWDILVWVLIAGIVGARIWHILTPTPSAIAQGLTTAYYLTHPLEAIAIWNGGLGIFGAVAGGAIALFFFTRRHHLSLLLWLDILAPSVALGQAIGRWGNFFNQELYGAPTNLPWAIYIDPQHRLPGFENVANYHPLFLYEMLWNFASVVFMLWLAHRFGDRLKKGDIFLVYLITYPLIRFLLEFLRLDSSYLAGINANQILALGILLAAAAILFIRHWLHRSAPKSIEDELNAD
ncbi:MAG TPA: prolipoprotein diacylglyceryl transferase [Anaerolineaceae bacterium]|nr:prolipoprotein diacylglyceryl transferase [Anaerolineaceae bacterium]